VRLLYFVIGAGVGAPTRYLIDRFFRDQFRFPVGILIVNVLGSFLIGVIANSDSDISFGLLGFCGALTTWSALLLDLFESATPRRFKEFAVNLLSNYGLGVFAAALGLWVGR
jgi:CrcB protein